MFWDKDIQQQITQNGYGTTQLLNVDEIEELKAFYTSMGHMDSKGTHVTMFNPSFEYRSAVDAQIKKVCACKIISLLKGHRALYANYMVKESGPGGDFPVHQDWTYVDESKYTSLAFWIPLSDVNEHNGALHVVSGSHNFTTKLRGPYVHEPFQELSQMIRSIYAKPIVLRAGEALVWDHRLIHFSNPNITAQPRIAVTLILVPEAASVIHCYAVPDSLGTRVEKYKVDTDFYMRYTIGQPPTGVELLEAVSQPIINFSVHDLETMYAAANLTTEKI